MTGIIITGIVIAKIYYGNINASEDPRVINAKHLYEKYNVLVEKNDYQGVPKILDSIAGIYSQFPDYRESFEIGVIYNNIGAACLNVALYKAKDDEKQLFLDSAEKYCKKAVFIYTNWISSFEDLSEENISSLVNTYYNKDDTCFIDKNIERIKKKRVKDILSSQKETPRRLSVAYSNLGIICRQNMDYDKAMDFYKKALALWDDNYSARNNINILLGRDLEERSALEKLFPKEK
ncbi:MAG: hypothetical protein DRP35_06665 [Candidatus Zixiibacteriota bacterium]|nr:MAG: hypothetical protein DRP35_06665 [candidate division Zixibacteria bacterium]